MLCFLLINYFFIPPTVSAFSILIICHSVYSGMELLVVGLHIITKISGAIWDNIVIQFILVLINIFVSLHNIFMPEKYNCAIA